ncbi:SNF2 family DNA or RNA helicase [Paraburkholderia sp. WC7.3g]|uniref:DEAD/DEAH box helicase n=1 Tax=Paraburkholderia sp. WC7.3g TaxID=2991070 RepID=UPI003D1F9BEC
MNRELTWSVEDDRVCVIDTSGQRNFPSARQVFVAAFSPSASNEAGLPTQKLISALPGVIFSRYPARTTIRLFGAPPAPIKAEVGVKTAAGVFVVPIHDQIIAGGSWYPIDSDEMAVADGWLTDLGIGRKDSLTIGQLLRIRAASSPPVELLDEAVSSSMDIAMRMGTTDGGIQGLCATLYPYQSDGVAFLRFVESEDIGCVLADEMGLGKTLQVIALLQAEQNEGRSPSLVVAPATLLENWRREIQSFAPRLRTIVHNGSARAGVAEAFIGAEVVIVSYDTVVRDQELLGDVPWDIVILDEAQNIKNPAAQRTLAVKKLPRRVSLAVTGTPVENHLEDLWSVSDFALPGLLGELSEFRGRYSDHVDDASRLASVVSPLILRRRVAEVARDLPDKIEIPQRIEMSESLALAYESIRLDAMAEYGAGAGIVATSKLRVLCAHPILSTEWPGDPTHDMPKYQRLLELLSELFESTEKVLIFTSYQGMIDLLKQDLPIRWPDVFFDYIDGRVNVPARQGVVDSFFSFNGPGALFLNPKAAGTGLNITAANHVIHYNPEWNPALTAQATARAFRRKQTRPVTVHHLYFADSVEEIMLERAEHKRQMAEGAVTGHDGKIDSSIVFKALQTSPIKSGRN